MIKTTVFFGAGAEVCFGISGGKNFAYNVLGLSADVMNEVIRDFYTNKLLKEKSNWYPNYHEKKWDKEKLLEAAIRKRLLAEPKSYDNVKDFTKHIEEMKEELSGNEKKAEEIIEKYTSYMGLLDERFHTLIEPKTLGPQKFWSVIACYTRAYLSIVTEILLDKEKETISKEQYMDILNDPIQTIKSLRKAIRTRDCYTIKNYYSILKKYSNTKIVTTNYTPCCEILSNITDIAYVHGKLSLFESPFEWRVYDAESTFPTDKLLFPYLFIQSGIKPIVEEIQLREYAKMLDFLCNSERTIIVGYRINVDDNHLNGILRKMIIDEKEIVYLDYDNDGTKKVLSRLHLSESESKGFICLPINKNNALEMFEKELSKG